MEEETQKTGMNKNMIMIGIAVVVIIAAIAIGGFVLTKNKEQAVVETPQDETVTGAMEETSEAGTTATYKDGTYEAKGAYSYHSGTESIDVTVTLANGVVEDVEVVAQAKAPISKEKQADFIANYKEQVVGKNIDEINLGKISGSSLTPIGFNAAIEDIKAQAQASS